MSQMRFLCVLCVCWSGLAAALPGQAVIRVPQNQPTITAALAQATAGTTILVQAGVYPENLTWPSVDGIRLVALGSAGQTVIDGGLNGRVVTVGAGLTRSTAIEGFTLRNGRNRDGAGLYLQSPIVVRGNRITQCEGTDATLNRGGGIHVDAGVSPRIEHNVITANVLKNARVNQGAGIYVGGGSRAEIVSNEITGNVCQGPDRSFGAGAYFDPSGIPSPLLAGNVIALNVNQATNLAQGGGVFVAGGTVRVTGNTIAGNRCTSTTKATGGGVAFGNLNGAASPMRNNIVVRNTVAASFQIGGGIHCDNANISFDFNDVWQNGPDDYFGCAPGPNDIALDPRFASTTDYRITVQSPCLDAGSDSAVETRAPQDAAGTPRRVDGNRDGNNGNGARVDIGGYEFTPARLEATAALGNGVAFAVTAPAQDSFAIAVSTGRGNAFIAPFGNLLLAAPLAIVGAGQGSGTVRVPLPYIGSLEGVPVFAQALTYRVVGSRVVGQFTNRVDLTLAARFGRPIIETFSDDSQFDTGDAAWAVGSRGLVATYGFGGNGRDGSLVVTGNVTLDGDTRPGPGLAEWYFQNLTVQSGATLTLAGRRPVRLNVLGNCLVDGQIIASGSNGRNGPVGKASVVGPLAGGAGGPGAGAGGGANLKPNNPLGALPSDLRGGPGYPKANRCNDINKSDNRLITVVEPNCGGGTGGNRGLPSGTILRSGCSGNGGGHEGFGVQTDFRCGNIGAFGREFGVRWVVSNGVGAVLTPTSGTGGGAGGNAAITTANPRPADDIVAGSAGGGGGGLEIVAAGSLSVRGSIRADGGNGGVGHATVVGSTTVQAGYGAGGSGGSIWLSGTAITVDNAATLSATGGIGNPMPPTPARSGNGGDGYIIVRDLSGTPSIGPSATVTPAPVTGRSQFTPAANGKSSATSKWYSAQLASPVWAFDASNPQTGVVVPGNDLTFAVAPTTGQQVIIAFQGAPDVSGQPDPNPANWVPQNGFAFDINSLSGKRLKHIRFKLDLDVGQLVGSPLPSRIAINRVALRY